jgi:uncharacterized metal-binding protein YceD (DUF177 family)
MDKPLPVPQQVIRMARITTRPSQWEGHCSAAALLRLAPSLAEPYGEVAWKVTAVALAGGEFRIDCIIEGFLWRPVGSTSQREALALERRIRLVPHEDALPPIEDEPPDEDFILAPEALDVVELVEEEILLSLPPLILDATGVSDSALPEPVTRSSSPFSVLANLNTKRQS